MALKVQHVRDDFTQDTRGFIKMLVVGEPGSGKTRTASTWPGVVYANAEGGLLSVRDRDVRRVNVTSMQDLEELKSMLDQPASVRSRLFNGPVETIVLDTLDEISRLIIRERLQSEKHETMEMRDWGYLGDQLRALVRGYRNLDMNVLFNVHVKGQEDSATGRLVYKPAIQGAMGDELAGYVDEALLLIARPTLDPKTNERVISRYFQTFPDSQHDWLKDRSGNLPMEFAVNFQDDYERLATLIFGPMTAAPAPAVPAPAKAKKKPAPRPAPTPPSVPAAPAEAPVATETEPETEDENVPDPGTPEPTPEPTPADPLADLDPKVPCTECGKVIESQDYRDLSVVRYGVPLCREHFAARKARR